MNPSRLSSATLALLLVSCGDPEPEHTAPETSVAPAEAAPVALAPAPSPAASPVARQELSLAVDGEGLRWFRRDTGAASSIAFGLPQAEMLASLERARGPAGRGTNQDCGAGPVQYANWPDGLSLVFQEGRFAGWGLDGRAAGAIGTAGGVGPGTTRVALHETYGDVELRQGSLGTEFSAGGFHGLLDGPGRDARITDMWAGVSCIAR